MARATEDPVRLRWALETLLLDGTREAIEQAHRLLTDDGRLKLIDGTEKERTEDTKLFAVLRFATENLSGQAACGLLVALSDSKEFQPDAYETGVRERNPKEQPYLGFSTERWSTLRRRQDTLLSAMGYVTNPTAELLASLGRSIPYQLYPVLSHDSAIRALGRIGTKEAFAVLLASGYLGTATSELAIWRNRPEIFRFLVDAYIKLPEEGSGNVLHDAILGEHLGQEGLSDYVPLPDYYLGVSPEHARAFMEEFDRLLDYDGHRPLTEEEKERVGTYRDLMQERAEWYEKYGPDD